MTIREELFRQRKWSVCSKNGERPVCGSCSRRGRVPGPGAEVAARGQIAEGL